MNSRRAANVSTCESLATPLSPRYAGPAAYCPRRVHSATSCGVLRDLGPSIQWVHSYVTDDKIYCVYNAPGEALVREHARQGGFPADAVSQVRKVISPITAEV